MQLNLSQFEKHQIAMIVRVTPYAMAGHLLNTTILAIALAGSVPPAELIVWCLYSYAIALFLLYRHLKNRGRSPRSFQRAVRKAAIYAFFLALPWSSLAVLNVGTFSEQQELILIALEVGMAASGTILLSAMPVAAFVYVSVILLPSALKCVSLYENSHLLIGALCLSFFGFLAALLTKTRRDIRERKNAELALAERTAQLALAGETALVGSYAYNVGVDTMQVSEGYAAMHGLSEGTTETLRSQWLARVHPEDVEWLEGGRSQAFKQRQVKYNVDYRIVLPVRGVRWIESRSFITYDGDGHPQRVVGVNIDVTDRKRAEGLLAESKARLADALAAGEVMAFEWDASTSQSRRSENAADILGQAGVAGPQGYNFLSRIHPDDRASLKTHIRELHPDHPSYALSFRYVRSDGREIWLEETARGEFDATGKLVRIKGLTRDVSDRKRAEERQRVLVAELDHRVKNALATVGAVVSQTQQSCRSVADFVDALTGRIQSMAAAHDLLSSRRWQGISLTELVRRELAPYTTSSNAEISGPEIILRAEAGQAMAMVLHELAINAAKFGALSAAGGHVTVSWRLSWDTDAQSRLCVHWQERGGPSVVAQVQSSYGTTVIRDLIPYELGGTVDFVHAPDGVCCNLEITDRWFFDNSKPPSDLGPQSALPR